MGAKFSAVNACLVCFETLDVTVAEKLGVGLGGGVPVAKVRDFVATSNSGTAHAFNGLAIVSDPRLPVGHLQIAYAGVAVANALLQGNGRRRRGS